MATREKLESALLNAHAAGDTSAARQLANALKAGQYDQPAATPAPEPEKPEPGVDYGRGLLKQLGQGLSFGFADELEAGLGAGLDALFQGQDFGDTYRNLVKDSRTENTQFAEENPKAALAANVAGGLMTGGAGAVRTGAAKALPKLAAYGAGTGALAGAGASEKESLGQLGEDVAVGAGTGALLGTVAPATGKFIGDTVKRVINPRGALDARVGQAVKGELSRSDVLPEEAVERLQSNPDLILGDLSQNLQQRTSGLATMPGRAAERAKGVLEERTTQQAQRILPELRDGLGADAKYYEALPALTKDMSKKAKPLYEKAYKTEITRLPQNVNAVMSEASNNGALRAARRLASAEMKDFDDLPAFQGLDYVKRALQDMEGTAIRSGRGQLASGLTQQRQTIGDYLKAKSPDYAKANKIWSSGKGDQDAMESGLRALTKDADFNRTAYNAMSQSEKKAFRVGLMQGIQNKIGTMAEDRDVVRQLKMIPKNRELIKMAFGNQKKFDAFMKKLDDESAMFETFSKSLRGSRTAPLQQAHSAVNDLGQGALSVATGGGLSSILAPALRQATPRLMQAPEMRNEAFRGALSDALLDNQQGQQVLQQLLGNTAPTAYKALGGAGGTGALIAPR